MQTIRAKAIIGAALIIGVVALGAVFGAVTIWRHHQAVQHLAEAALTGRSGGDAGLRSSAAEAASSAKIVASLMIGSSFAVALGLVGCCVLLFRGIVNPVARLARLAERLAQGDTDVDLDQFRRADELGALARGLEGVRDYTIERARADAQAREAILTRMVDDLNGTVSTVASGFSGATQAMRDEAQTLLHAADVTASRSNAIADSAQAIAHTVATVASATEELTASVAEIGRQVRDVADTSGTAVARVQETAQAIDELGAVFTDVTGITETIQSIAARTNLLALNATIEAARAGEVGRGFAIVASEVKQLANQTSRATTDISGRIERMQEVGQRVMAAIDAVETIIATMSQANSEVSAAVVEQGLATSEIARSVQNALQSTEAVAQDARTVVESARQTDQVAGAVMQAASDLRAQSDALQAAIDSFSGSVRAA